MIVLDQNRLSFRFPEVHEYAVLNVELIRTLRIPDDDREYPLPPGLGSFPLSHVDDFADHLPASWGQHGGVFLPMYQAEALWIRFSTFHEYPFAIKVATGKVDAVSGEGWSTTLSKDPQNYVVAPDQPWLDGYCLEKGTVRQFVAMPLGEGYTAEEQLTGLASHGGLQIMAYPMKSANYQALQAERASELRFSKRSSALLCCESSPTNEMGLAPGGMIRQEIYEDDYGLDSWERAHSSRCFVHILNSTQYAHVTGKTPPGLPPSAQAYNEAGLPWFDFYAADRKAVGGSAKLAGLIGVVAKRLQKGLHPLEANEPLEPREVRSLGGSARVREGDF